MADIAGTLIWALRLILPIVLFWFYFKLNQSPKEEGTASPGPVGHVHSREAFMDVWKALARLEKPQCLATLTMVGEEQAPSLFAAAPSGKRGGAGARRENVRDRALQADRDRGDRRRDRGERGDRGDRGEHAGRSENSEKAIAPSTAPRDPSPAEAENGRDRSLQVDREGVRRRERGERGDRGHRGERAGSAENSERAIAPSGATRDPPAAEPVTKEEDKVNPESPLKVKEGGPPPPPPPPGPKSRAAAEPKEKAKHGFQIRMESNETANHDAQMVLKGTTATKQADVAKALYDQLATTQVVISERTLTLMIEAFILASDLKNASDFLVKMEVAGFCPEQDLLDKVMDLHSLQKSKREQDKEAAKNDADAAEPASWTQADPLRAQGAVLPSFVSQDAEVLEQARPKLSLNARVFVPNSCATPEVFVPMTCATPDEFSEPPLILDDTELCTAVQSMQGEPAQEQAPAARTPLRTALRTGARSFISKENVQFGPRAMPSWAPEFRPQEGAFIPMENVQFEPMAMPTLAPEFVPQQGAFIPMENRIWAPEFVPQEFVPQEGAFIPMETVQFDQSAMPTWAPEFRPQEGAFIPMENVQFVPVAMPALSPEFVPQQGAFIPMENRIWAPEFRAQEHQQDQQGHSFPRPVLMS